MEDKREVINASDEAASSTPARSSSELYCDSCIQDGYELLAEGYCLDCGHHLCDECFKIHRKPQPLRHHQLLSKDAMPMTKPKKVPVDECKEKCRVHKDEIMKYFCEDHGEVGCNVCVTLSHRTCNVGYIPTLAEDLFNNDEYKSFRRSLKSMPNRVSDFATTYVRRIINDTGRNISAIIKRRKEVNDFFDKLEREAKGELQQNLSKNLKKITHLLSSCNKLDVWFQEEQEDLNNKEDNGQKCCLFVDMKLMKKEVLDEFEKELIDIEKRPEHMSYIPSNETVHMACDTSAMLGVFVRRDSVVNVSQSETDISNITLLTNDKLVAVNDKANCALIVNAEQSQVTKSRSFPFPAFGFTRVSDSWFAAWYNNKIGEYYWTNREILLLKTILCPGLRWPIVFMNNTYIGFTESTGSYGYAVRIIDERGNEMKTFPSGENKKRNTFVDPHYIVVNQDNTLLYVTDNGGRIVKCLTMDGDLRAEFRPQHDWDPEGIAMSCDGTVYVCDYMNSNIHILTFDLREVGVINGDMFGIKQPLGIVYCEANHKLYVGMENSTNMVVLKVETPDKFLEDNNK